MLYCITRATDVLYRPLALQTCVHVQFKYGRANIMFLAKFSQVTSDKFTADKNGEMPFIGELKGGVAKATLFNGTMFKREKFKPGKMYACQNIRVTIDTEDGPKEVWNVDILDEVPVLDLKDMLDQVGKPQLLLETVEEEQLIEETETV